MEQKRVSLKVAKAIKKVGYHLHKVGVDDGKTPIMYDKELNEENWADCDAWYLPTYLDVWLWLWREKGIEMTHTNIEYLGVNIRGILDNEVKLLKFHKGKVLSHDPEKAIIAAIEYLVDNNLIK